MLLISDFKEEILFSFWFQVLFLVSVMVISFKS
jgi:hypothetical protein